jgi:hypothetical protein
MTAELDRQMRNWPANAMPSISRERWYDEHVTSAGIIEAKQWSDLQFAVC